MAQSYYKKFDEWKPRRIPNFLFLKRDEITRNGDNENNTAGRQRRTHQVLIHEREKCD